MQFIKDTIGISCVIIFVIMVSSAQAAQTSVYAITKHSNSTIAAFKIVNNEIEYQTETNLDFGSGVVGLAIDPDSWTIFTSYDGSYNIGIINAKKMQPEEDPVVVAPWELAGIVWDNTVDRLYGMRREGSTSLDNIVIYEWNPVSKELTQDGNTIKLPSFPNNGMGITLDEEGLLYATDNTNTVYVYNTNNWSFVDSFDVNVDGNDRKCVAIAVYNDGDGNNWVYTGGYSHTSGDHNYLVKTLTESPYTSSDVNVEDHVSGVTVDQTTGLVYITSFNEDIRVYDSNLNFQYSDGNNVDGNPADIIVHADVSYKPPLLNITKQYQIDPNDPNDPNNCARPADYITYTISYNANGHEVNNVIITDHLPEEIDLIDVNASDGGTYDMWKSTVTWEIGPLDSNDSGFVTVTIKVDERAEPNGFITNFCEIESDSSYDTAEVNTPVCYWCGDIIYVDVNAPTDYNTGASWQYAYKDLQNALQDAPWVDTKNTCI